MKKQISWQAALVMVMAAVLLTASVFTVVGCMETPDITVPASSASQGGTTSSDTMLFDAEAVQSVIEKFQSVSLTELDTDRITADLIKGFVEGTGDVYAAYMTAEEYDAYNASYAADYVGIGITVTLEDDGSVTVIEVTPDAPAEEAGFCVGDVIIGVDGVFVASEEASVLDDISLLIRGEEGTYVDVTVKRGEETLTLHAQRRRVERKSVRHSVFEYGTQKAGYILITGFETETATEFKEALDALQAENVDFLILDLRNNPGGLLTSVVASLAYVLPKNTLLCTLEYKNGTDSIDTDAYCNEDAFADSALPSSVAQILSTPSGRVYYNEAYLEHTLSLPMAILVNENSASAAELFTSVMRDYDKAVIVGENTFGKGCMQVTYGLENGTALKLTTAYYTPPCGVNYDVTTDGPVGIAPHIEVVFTEAEKRVNLYTADHRKDRQFVAAFNALTDAEPLPVPSSGEAE